MLMQLSDFAYDLPSGLIAQSPAIPRGSARLMLVDRARGTLSHHHIRDLPQLIPRGYSIVANNTRVFPARLKGHKPSGGKVEVLLTTPLGHSRYRAISRPSLRTGDTVIFTPTRPGLVGLVKRPRRTDYEFILHFNQAEAQLRTTISTIGSMPTPPYIKKLLRNPSDYQTIYAKYGFSAAAPTAGLHFSPKLLRQIKQDHPWHELTLNVGLGTFLPVKVDKVEDHHMHAESYTISPTLAHSLTHPLLAVGTTTLRALESCPLSSEPCDSECSELLRPGSYSTSIFIYPPYRFTQVDALLTNFHLPGSTLLMLVSAFCCAPETQEPFTTFANSLLGRAYAEAIRLKYRFFSFGDAMLII